MHSFTNPSTPCRLPVGSTLAITHRGRKTSPSPSPKVSPNFPKIRRGDRASFVVICLFLGMIVPGITVLLTGNASAFHLHMPCTGSHDCPRGAFCRHQTNFRGECIIPPQSPFGVTGPRQVEFPPQSDPPEHLFGSMPILRCSQLKPCPAGFVCARYGSSKLEEALCVPYSEPCWSTADCSPSDFCDKPDDEFSLSGICRPREDAE